ncbi:hypothetical protein AB0C77_36780 [Streptomyces sp. NPDC048629]|uniref:hypothetical protein n=1 Tax=Streptomyces sp. NPDC048629 TaxID=3154824 RepID=UPI003439C156
MTASVLEMPTGAQMMQDLVDDAGESSMPAADMADLAELVRGLLDVRAGRDTRVGLGGGLFDVVVTGSDPQAQAALAVMDVIQGRCGPVIESPEVDLLFWLVPPGSADQWAPHPHAVCLGAPRSITLPPRHRTAPPGPFWVRPCASDRLVPARPFWDALARLQPEPTPHAVLAARGISP